MLKSLLLVTLIALSGCANTTATGGAPATSLSTADEAGAVMQEITQARKASTALAVAGKITWSQDDQAQAALTLFFTGADKARTTALTDPATAAAILSSILSQLAAYQQGILPATPASGAGK